MLLPAIAPPPRPPPRQFAERDDLPRPLLRLPLLLVRPPRFGASPGPGSPSGPLAPVVFGDSRWHSLHPAARKTRRPASMACSSASAVGGGSRRAGWGVG